MNPKTNSFGNRLAEQETMNSENRLSYQQNLNTLLSRKVGTLTRLICGLIALGGVTAAVSLGMDICKPMHHDVEFIVKCICILLLACVLFYTALSGIVAIRGTIRTGSTTPVILGAVVLSGFFTCLWAFLIFVLPKLNQLIQVRADTSFESNLWIIGMVCIFLFIGFFGVLTAGITFIIHLQYKHFSQTRQKLLEMELAIADLSEKLPPDNNESAGVPR